MRMLEADIQYGLKHPEIKEDLVAYLKEIVKDL